MEDFLVAVGLNSLYLVEHDPITNYKYCGNVRVEDFVEDVAFYTTELELVGYGKNRIEYKRIIDD